MTETAPAAIVGKITYGDRELTIYEAENIRPLGVDAITDARIFNGVVCLSLGSIISEAGGEAHIRVATRLRLSMASAQDLANILNDAIKAASIPAGQMAN